MALHQALKNLCFKSGWCYAVFWKLKRRSRMVLTWEDGYHEYHLSNGGGKTSCSETGGNPLVQVGTRRDESFSEGQIGLAVAKMSYCVYFLGEGIIGRVAFTGKHQWVFGDSDTNALGITGCKTVNSRCALENYPSGWEAQFAAGIKTIVVIAVPQGVVQLGSTQMMMESLEWVEHVKSSFGTPQSVPGAIVSNMASEGQGGNAAVIPSKLSKSNSNVLPSRGMGDSHYSGLQSLVHGFDGQTSMFPHPNSQMLRNAVEGAEPSQSLLQKTEQQPACDVDVRLTTLMPSVVSSGLQTLGAVSAFSEVDLGSSSNQKMTLQCERMSNYQYGDHRNTQLRNSLVQCSTVDAFNRASGLKPDANISRSLYEQSSSFLVPTSSRVLESGSHTASASGSEMNLQHSKGAFSAVFAPFGFNTSTSIKAGSLNGIVGNMGGVAAGQEDCINSFERKGDVDPEFLVDSLIRDTPPRIVSSIDECLKSHTKDPVSLSDGDVLEKLVPGGWDNFDSYLASVAQGKNNNCDCSFGVGDELSQALGPAFRQSKDMCEKVSKPVGIEQHKVVVEQRTSGATCALSDISAVESVPTWGLSYAENKPYFPECKAEPLLDAAVASASSSYHSMSTTADDSFSCRTFSALESDMPALKFTNEAPFRHLPQDCVSQSFVHSGLVDCEASVNNQALSKIFGNPPNSNMSTKCSPLKAIINSWSEDMQSVRSDSTQTSQSKKSEDLNKATRKRARPGESTRPRPKDRQQIQDRVRELREIVPNGSKCSIDALLEKTIKHMLFLQNVTVHAENLKKNGELKNFGPTRDDAESGASWALELGGEDTGGPPILVKNLSQPRQLLVEMFCEEKGHFLEIADMIRSLGLTILKGVMESRSNKIWARFVVEANRDVRRVDIMMSLMHLLHVNSSSSSSLTIASQTAPLRSQPGIDSSSSSQTQTLCGFQQSSLRA